MKKRINEVLIIVLLLIVGFEFLLIRKEQQGMLWTRKNVADLIHQDINAASNTIDIIFAYHDQNDIHNVRYTISALQVILSNVGNNMGIYGTTLRDTDDVHMNLMDAFNLMASKIDYLSMRSTENAITAEDIGIIQDIGSDIHLIRNNLTKEILSKGDTNEIQDILINIASDITTSEVKIILQRSNDLE